MACLQKEFIIIEFRDGYTSYIRFFFKNGCFKSYKVSDLDIKKNMVVSPKVKNLIEYYSRIADITGLRADDGTNILKAKFGKLDFISDDTVLAKYLNSSSSSIRSENDCIIFPFGCNASQIAAVRNALVNQISVIEGPPGTGKTQTILNILVNAVVNGQRVAIVSNNNSAIQNVVEKLSAANGLDFMVALLGNKANQEKFLENQPSYPSWLNENIDFTLHDEQQLYALHRELKALFEKQNELKRKLSQLHEWDIEAEKFTQCYPDVPQISCTMSSEKLLLLFSKCNMYSIKQKRLSFWFKL